MNNAQHSSSEGYSHSAFASSVNPSDVFGPPQEWFTTDDPFLKRILAQEATQMKEGSLRRETRPPIPYSVLISEAMKGKADRMMTLQEIYDWFERFHPFYCENNHNWRNSVRHTLSSNRMFKRIPRYNNASGRGSMWALANGSEQNSTNQDMLQSMHKRRKSMNDMPPLMEFYLKEGMQYQNQKVIENVEEIMKGFKPNPELSMSQTTVNNSSMTESSSAFLSMPSLPFNDPEMSNVDLNDFMVEFE